MFTVEGRCTHTTRKMRAKARGIKEEPGVGRDKQKICVAASMRFGFIFEGHGATRCGPTESCVILCVRFFFFCPRASGPQHSLFCLLAGIAGVRINYVSGLKSSYVTLAGSKPLCSCCSSSGSRESLWHNNKENNKIAGSIPPPLTLRLICPNFCRV